jgi:hypothetical protein
MTTTHRAHIGHVGGHVRHAEKVSRRKTRQAFPEHDIHDEIMVEELHAVHGELSRVDSKSSILLGFAAGGLLLTTAGIPPGPGGWLIKLGVGIAAASIVPLLFVVRPRLGSTGFPHHARRTVEQIRAELIKVNARTWRSEQLIALSRIAVRKCRLLKIAASLQTAALVVAAAGALLLLMI